jgi:hypothetical protein
MIIKRFVPAMNGACQVRPSVRCYLETVTLAPFGFGVADASKSVVRVEVESVIWTPAVRLKSNVAMVSMKMNSELNAET